MLLLDTPLLHFSIGSFPIIENSRALPQQAATAITNNDDIESYISRSEPAPGAYIRAIDIPSTELDVAMRDLDKMGVTAGSLFPGLDAACEELRRRLFD